MWRSRAGLILSWVGILAAAFLGAALTPCLAGGVPRAFFSPSFLPVEPVRTGAGGQRLQGFLRQVSSLIEAGQLDQAEVPLKTADEMARRIGSPGGMILVHQFQAQLYIKRGRMDLAEPLLKGVIGDIGRRSGRTSEFNIAPMHSLGALYLRQHRLPEAEDVVSQALALARGAYGGDTGQAAELENTLAAIEMSQGKSEVAERLLTHAIAVLTRAADRLSVAQVSDTLATLYLSTGRKDLARDAYGQALVVERQMMGAEHAITLATENNIAVLDRDNGNLPAAEAGFGHVLAVYQHLLGEANPTTLQLRNSLGWLALAKGDPAAGLDAFRISFAGYTKLRVIQAHDYAAGPTIGVGEYEVSRTVLGLLTAIWDMCAKEPAKAPALLDEAFAASQAVHRSEAANALAQTSARLVAENPQLAGLVREEQDLAAQWRQTDGALTQALRAPAANRDVYAETRAHASLDDLNARISTLDQTINKNFTRYATLVDPPPASIADVQKWLRPNEVLVEIVTFGNGEGEGTYVWLVGAQGVKWRKRVIGLGQLADYVTTLRCGLDGQAWEVDSGKDCTARVGPKSEMPPFSYKAARELFDVLFGDLRGDLDGKSVILVLPEPLSSLPFQVLLTGPADHVKHGQIPWFGRSNALSVVPSVVSLGILRTLKIKRAPDPFVGFGNPVLQGSSHCSKGETTFWACPKKRPEHFPEDPAGMFESQARNASVPSLQNVYREDHVNQDVLREQCPLPETEYQLRCTAQSLDAPASTVHVQASATVTEVQKTLLQNYRVIVFATHGLLSSDTKMLGGSLEPALLMTPPTSPTAEDQGLLTASKIARLHLNADWIVLTACNSGQPGSGGEAMSGLASAFLYAGARTVLASHWSVFTVPTVLLASNAFSQVGANPEIGRAEAMRRAMITLMNDDDDFYAHPASWAPFTVFGEPGPL